eukprot:m.170387 g.170387  ORF g.170387 m.170387 type:complete len:337 (+) comp18267_c0_seq1:250-1260(+)
MSSVVQLIDDDDDAGDNPNDQRGSHVPSEKEIRENKILAVFVGFAGAFIEMFSTVDYCRHAQTCGHSRVRWAIAVGLIGAAICLGRLIKFVLSPTVDWFDLHISFGLLVVWSFGAAFNTSSGGPFTKTNNGYYATWLALLAATYFTYLSVTGAMRESLHSEVARQNKSLLVLLIAAIVETAVSADVCDNNTCSASAAVATTVGVLTIAGISGHAMLVRKASPYEPLSGKILAPTLMVLWVVGAGVNTGSKGPFTSSCDANVPSANGYFSTWIAFFAAMHYAWAVLMTVLPDGTLERARCAMGVEDDTPSQTATAPADTNSVHGYQPLSGSEPGLEF